MPRAAPAKAVASQENGIGREQLEIMLPNSGPKGPDQKQQVDEQVDKLKSSLKTDLIKVNNNSNKSPQVQQHQKSNEVNAEKQQQQAEQLAQSLRSAANEGKVELVRLLLKCGADPNAQDAEFGDTPLHLAAWQGFSETVQVLCKHRANTNAKNKAQFTPLHMACQQGHNQTARLLLMANAKTELKNSYGDTPLHTATRYGHAGVARILLSAKCNPNQVTLNNDTPLHIAAARGRRKLTKILMQNGAELVIKNKQNETAMDIALRLDLIKIQELIANPPPKTSRHHHQARNNHNHHHHHHHHHHHNTARHHERYERSVAQVARHQRKSMTNLISVESNGANNNSNDTTTTTGQRRGLSISSSNVLEQHCAAAANLVRPATSRQRRRRLPTLDDDEPEDSRRPIGSSAYDFHVIEASGPRSSAELAQLQQRRPRARTQTLAAGLGVSAVALSELTGAQLRDSPTALGEPRPRPSSAAAGSVSAGPMMELNACNRDLIQRPQPRQLRVKPKLPRLSPSASLRSSRVGGKMQRGLAPRPLRRLSLVASNSVPMKQCEPEASPQPLPIKQQKLAPALKRRSASVAMLSGRLSLAQLRKMVKRRAARRLSMVSQTSEQVATRTSSDLPQTAPNKSSQENEGEQKLAHTIGGRRQQRAEREQLEQANAQMVAPNGTKLTVTKALAPLDDDSQLYAIPRKSSKTTSKTNQITPTADSVDQKRPQDSGETARREAKAASGGGGGGAQDQSRVNRCQVELVDGPALTASNQSLASCNSNATGPTSKSNAAIPLEGPTSELDKRKLDSSSDEFVESLAGPLPAKKHNKRPEARHQNESRSESENDDDDDDKDFCAPGYSVIKSRALIGKEPEKLAHETSETCTCSLDAHYRGQQVAGDKVVEAELGDKEELSRCNEDDELLRLRAGAGDRDELDQASPKLIRPRSVLGSANAELIAAQKNLAAAAAAKVHRDRQAKMARSQRESLGDNVDRRGDFRELTVKTQLGSCNTNSSFWLQHHQQHQTLVATAAARLQADSLAAAAVAATNQKVSLAEHSAATLAAVNSKRALGDHVEMISTVNGNSVGGGGGQSTLTSAANQRRSGTNSVGLSDSSPSNNGADSDNSSQQTQTSGSMNTDETISSSVATAKNNNKQQQQQQSSHLTTANTKRANADQQQSRPFGILSRILSNNNKRDDDCEANASKRPSNNNSPNKRTTNGLKRIVQTIASNAAGARNEQVATKTISKQQPPPPQQSQQVSFSGSLSSSSALSSPSMSTTGQSPNSTTDSTTGLAVQCDPKSKLTTTTSVTVVNTADDEGCALDDDGEHNTSLGLPNRKPQLDLLGSSRSRCPIVLGSQSSGLAASELDSATSLPPRLPPKSALRSQPAASELAPPNYRAHYYDHHQDALVNGLPRVASCNQISSSAGNQSQETEASLCSYHALNRSHMIQAEYSPHLPYTLGRYSIHETCDPSAPGSGRHNYYQKQHYFNGAPNNATPNYHHRFGPTPFEGDSTLADVSMVCHYAQDDSIFVSPYQLNEAERLRQNHFNHFATHQQQPNGARPKSSLGSVCYVPSSSSASPPMSRQPVNLSNNSQQLYGQRFSAINSQPVSILKTSPNSAGRQLGMTLAVNNSNGNQHSNQAAQCAKNGAHQMNQIFDSSHLIRQNSIYAPGDAFQKSSELTVLPTSCHSTNSIYSSSLVSNGSNLNSPIKFKLDPNQQQAPDTPPKLPPKTGATITTVGKLTRVSINSTPSNGTIPTSEGTTLTVKRPSEGHNRACEPEKIEDSLC